MYELIGDERLGNKGEIARDEQYPWGRRGRGTGHEGLDLRE
jgi:hypothetical protein